MIGRPGRQRPRDRVDARHLERLVSRQRRQDARQPPREHRLARSRRAGEQHVVPAGRGELERPPPALLAAHLGEVGQERLLELVAARRRRRTGCPPRPEGRRPPGRGGARGRRRFPASAASGADSAAQRSRVRPARRAPSATAIVPATGRTRPSSESSPTQRVLEQPVRRELVRAGEHRECDREVEPRPLLAERGGREVDGDPVSAGHGSIALTMPLCTRCFASWHARSASPTIENAGRSADDEVRLDLDAARLEADDGGGEGSREHTTDGTAEPHTTSCRIVPRFVPISGRALRSASRRRRVSTRSTRRRAARAAVDVPLVPLVEPEAGALEDLRVEIATVVDHDAHRAPPGASDAGVRKHLGDPVDVVPDRGPAGPPRGAGRARARDARRAPSSS